MPEKIGGENPPEPIDLRPEPTPAPPLPPSVSQRSHHLCCAASGWRAIYSAPNGTPYALPLVGWRVEQDGSMRPMVYLCPGDGVVPANEALRILTAIVGPGQSAGYKEPIGDAMEAWVQGHIWAVGENFDVLARPAPRCHEDGGLRCLAAHNDGQGNSQPQCIKCRRCGQWIKPGDMAQECEGRAIDVPNPS